MRVLIDYCFNLRWKQSHLSTYFFVGLSRRGLTLIMADKNKAVRPSTARNGQGPASALGRKQPPEIKGIVGDGKKLVAKPGRTNLLPTKPSAGPKTAAAG